MTQTFTITDPQAPATEKQLAFLTSLVKDRDCPSVAERFRFSTTVGFLAKGAASKLIDEALEAPKKTAVATSANIASALTLSEPQLTELPAFGYYDIAGTVYHWDVTGKDLSPTLRVLAKITNWDGVVKGSWKKFNAPWAEYKLGTKITGTWNYKGKGPQITKLATVPKVLADAVLAGAKPLTLEQVGAMGKAFTFCVRCGATLTDPVSVANGIGPVCITYWS
jgi:hypothetical protein